jgi:hypothetical protein
MNRAAWRWLFLRINLAWNIGRDAGSGQHDWKERRLCHILLGQFASLQSPTPLEYLVRVHTVSMSHQRNTRA